MKENTALIRKVSGGWIVEITNGIAQGGGEVVSVHTDFVKAIKAVASAVGFSADIQILPPPC